MTQHCRTIKYYGNVLLEQKLKCLSLGHPNHVKSIHTSFSDNTCTSIRNKFKQNFTPYKKVFEIQQK